MVVWNNRKEDKDEGLPLTVRKNIAVKVMEILEKAEYTKEVADSLSGYLADLLSKDFGNDETLPYAIGVATGQIRRYIASRVYELITKPRK
jgi:hypothetical protein